MDNSFQNNNPNLSDLSRISIIEYLNQNNPDESIIDQIGMLHPTYNLQGQVKKTESFLYYKQGQNPSFSHQKEATRLQKQAYNNNKPIHHNDYSLKKRLANQNNPLPPNFNSKIYQKRRAKDQPQIKPKQPYKSKKQVQEEIIYENMLLQRKFNANKHNMPYHNENQLKTPSSYIKKQFGENNFHRDALKETGSDVRKAQEMIGQNGELQDLWMRIQEDYNKSRVIKLYNFILKQLPTCPVCQQYCTKLNKSQTNISLKCTKCQQTPAKPHFPLIGILYDLENKPQYEQQISAFQAIFAKLQQKLQLLYKEIKSIEQLKERLGLIKSLNRKKYRQINESRNLIKRYSDGMGEGTIQEIIRRIPREYLDMIEKWQDIHQYNSKQMQNIFQVYKIMPVYLFNNSNKFITNLQKILAYQKQQGIRISVSQHIRIPIKKLQEAIFVVDGTYNIPIFQNVKHLQLEFANKKTMRQLSLLFQNLPRQIYSLSFYYNHKLHSHISAQTFPILKTVLMIPSVQKIAIKLEAVKDFEDLMSIASVLTPKIQFRIVVTKHLYSKDELNLPGTFFKHLFDKIGKNLIKFQLSIPQSKTSCAAINYLELIKFDKLCLFKLNRCERQQKRNKHMKVLEQFDEDYERQKKGKLVFKQLLANRIRLIRVVQMVRKIHLQEQFHQNVAASIIGCLL